MKPNIPQGRMMAQTSGGLVLPASVAAEKAKDEAKRWKPVALSYCPMIGPFEVPAITEPIMKPLPVNPTVMVPWVQCTTCGKLHMVNSILTEAEPDDPEAVPDGAFAPKPNAPTLESVEAQGRATGDGASQAFADLAVFHIQREDAKGEGGYVAGLVVSAMDKDFNLCKPEDGDSATLEATIDGTNKADLQARVMAWVEGLEAGSGKTAVFGGYEYAKGVWEAKQ